MSMSSSDPAPPADDGKVFISHSSRDRKMAQTISAALEHRGFRCWISSRDIGPGENFQEAIVRAIRQSRVMVLVFTGNANNSNEIKKEMALASQHNLAVIPVRVEDVVPNDAFAYEFATRQWIDTFDNWEHAIERLAGQLSRCCGAEPWPSARGSRPAPPRHRCRRLRARGEKQDAVASGCGGRARADRRRRLFRDAAAVRLRRRAQAAAPAAAAPQAAPAPTAAAPRPRRKRRRRRLTKRRTPPRPPKPRPRNPRTVGAANRAYINRNYERAFRLYQPLAEQGLPGAEFRLGFLYHQGLGTQRDFAAAMTWYRKAADQGYTASHVRGRPALLSRPRRAAEPDRGAALVPGRRRQGLAGRARRARQSLSDRPGGAARFRRGDALLPRGRQQERSNAGYFIGLLYERGLGVPPDPQQARAWMQKAAELGSDDAKSWLALH